MGIVAVPGSAVELTRDTALDLATMPKLMRLLRARCTARLRDLRGDAEGLRFLRACRSSRVRRSAQAVDLNPVAVRRRRRARTDAPRHSAQTNQPGTASSTKR
jgi:hypothetical protein